MKVHLKDVRLSYAQLFEPKQVNGQGEAKFSAAFLFPANHPAVAELKKAIQAVATEKWGAKAGEVYAAIKAKNTACLHDGAEKPEQEAYKGNMFVNASNKIKPLVIDGNRSPLTATDGKPYSGCYVNGIVEVWAQDNQFGKRINASLMGIQFLRDGPRLAGGGVAGAEDFEAIPEAAPVEGAANQANAAAQTADVFG